MREKKIHVVVLTLPSVKALMTIPNAVNDLLIFLASSRVWPDAPVLPTYVIWDDAYEIKSEQWPFFHTKHTDLFRTSQIDQIKLSTLCCTRIHILLCDCHNDNGVTSGTFCIHIYTMTPSTQWAMIRRHVPKRLLTGVTNHTVVTSTSHNFINFVRWSNIDFQKTLDIDALGFVFMNR